MIITLLTDFGSSDYFVAAMKGRILSIDRTVTVVDISHDVPAHDIEAGAFLLGAVHQEFPAGTIHVVVIDPGVGSQRLPIVARGCGQLFVAPDNGVLSRVFENDTQAVARVIESDGETAVGSTFHGRDIFAPTAARLATGLAFEAVGRQVPRPVTQARTDTRSDEEGTTQGRVIHIDHFGNCITNVRVEELVGSHAIMEVAGVVIREIRQFYESSEQPGPFLIRGSAGYVEISMLRASAAEMLKINRGDPVRFITGSRGRGESGSLLRLL